jgi:hypothetical protein
MKIQQTVVLLIPGHRQKDKQMLPVQKNSFIRYKECLNAMKTAYNKTTKDKHFFPLQADYI